MKWFIVFLFILVNTLYGFTQNLSLLSVNQKVKPPISIADIEKWPFVRNPVISNDGRFALYTICNNHGINNTLVIKALNKNWEFPVIGCASGIFTGDSRIAVFLKKDSLCLLKLGTSYVEVIPNVSSFKQIKQQSGEILVYQLKSSENELIIYNLKSGNKQKFAGISNYLFHKDGYILVLLKEANKQGAIKQSLNWVNLSNGTNLQIWQGSKAGNFTFDDSGNQIAFTVEDKGRAIWYYKVETEKAVPLSNNDLTGVDSTLMLDKITRFSKDGSRIFITLKEMSFQVPKQDAVKVDIWSYTDEKLQSMQLKAGTTKGILFGSQNYTSVLDINTHSIVQLQYENETIKFFDGKTDDIAFVINTKGDFHEKNWNSAANSTYFLISTRDGNRIQIKMYVEDISPTGKYLICKDDACSNYFSYDLSTQTIFNITESLPIPLTDPEFDEPGLKPRDLTIGGWLKEENGIVIYDKYDLWLVDHTRKKKPISLTNGYGRRNNIVFRMAKDYSFKRIANNEDVLLKGFNRSNKDNGFYSIKINIKGDPKLLSMGPYKYEYYSYYQPKIEDPKAYIVQRENAKESANYFVTTDFKTFNPISTVYPELSYNWLIEELITFKTLGNQLAQGILYKPENFDPKIKYPVIFNFYEKKTDNLNQYHMPEFFMSEINVPWFVSNGYLVFMPDIHFVIGEPGESAYSAVVGAAKFLSKFSWVDSTKMGIQGHSFGGYHTNYLVTHSNIFTAAMSSSGPSDLVSGYGSIGPRDGMSLQFFYELSQFRMGATLWQKPELFIKNSPVFFAHRVETPLLMMNNKEDGIVPFSQGVELFTALRRLGKKVWMLQYDGETHSLSSEAVKKDYSMRIFQFFDHYLKGVPAPKWMIHGIPAKMKGVQMGFELIDLK